MYDIKKRLSFLPHISTGAAAGLFAGILVGLWETLVVFITGGEFLEFWILPYAVIYYGILGAIIGIGAGIAGGIICAIIKWTPSRGVGFMLYGGFILFFMDFWVGRYRYYQIILHSEKVFHIADWLKLFSMIALASIIAVVVWKLLSRFGIFRAMSGILGALIWYVALAVVTLIIGALWTLRNPTLPDKSALASDIPGKNVILIIVDTLRYDRLSVNGYKKMETPHFDKFASDAINYKDCIAQSSWTKPQIATILTGMYASSHKAMGKADVLPDDVPTIAEVFAKQGYYTVGFVDNVNITEAFNFQQGFDEFYFMKPSYYFLASESVYKLAFYSLLRQFRETKFKGKIWPQNYYQPAEDVNHAVTSWLDKNNNKRFFMLIHYMDPHDPFFRHPYNGVGYSRAANQHPDGKWAQTYSDTYDQEVAYHDEMLGQIMDYLKENNLFDSSLIVVTADHGEEFYEHKGWWHGYTLYDEALKVPLMIKPVAGTFQPYTDTTYVRSIDISPTIVGLLDIQTPSLWQGENLFTRKAPPEYIFSEEVLTGNVLYSVRDRQWKYIQANKGNPRKLPTQELFDIINDPHEKHNLMGTQPEVVTKMAPVLEQMKLEAAGHAVKSQETEIDAATRERLKALGYIK